MNEIMKKDEIPSRSQLSKLGITGIAYSVGGVLLLFLQAIARGGLGYVIGGLITIVGIASFTSKDKADRKAGAIIMTAGILVLVSKIRIPVIAPIAGVLMSIGAIGLLAMGIWNGIKFFIGLKKRS